MGLLLLMGGADYNIRSELFSQNEQGLWLDPSDMTATKAAWRRNLLTYTEQFGVNTGGWSKQGVTVTDNTDVDPNGQTTADTLLTTVGVSNPGVYQNVNLVAGQQYTFSVWLKAGTISSTKINCWGPGVGVFSLVDVSLTSNWQRFAHTFTSPVTGTGVYSISPEGFIVGTGKTVIAWGAQLELGSSASTYQPITDFSTEFKAAFPTHTLYQDSNGVTPCTAAGDPVGLILDQRQGALTNLGAELTTNGGFDSDTWWSKGAGVTIAAGVCQYTAVALNAGVFRTSLLTAGKFYVVDFTVSGLSSGGVRVYSGGNRTSTISTNGTYRLIVLAGSSDASLIFEATSAGTTLALDNVSVREVPGNHAYQSTSGARPTLARVPFGGRRNLLTRTEEFDNAAWTKQNGSVTQNATTAPDGTATADAFVASNGAATFKGFFQAETTAAPKTLSFYVKKGAANWMYMLGYNGTNNCWFDLQNVVVGTRGANYTNSTITSIGSGWFRLTATLNSGIAGNTNVGLYAADSDNSTTFTGDGSTISFYAWGAQLETGSSATNYQKVTSTHDVTEAGQADCWALSFDGSDDHLLTNAIDFAGTDEMTVIAGVRKLSDAAVGIVVELSADTGANNGTFYLLAGPPSGTGPRWTFATKGTTVRATQSPADYAAPITNVIGGQGEISGDISRTRINGVQVAEVLTDQGTGNYGNYVLYIGRRGGSSLPFNGLLHHFIARGASTSGSKLTGAERLAGKKSGLNI